ncbi:ATP-binding cassette domain-containing protein [Neptunicella marina]|uniref:ATP-binding cassette domain-containing protein n=1 Tax=Neptunicella marina TaxID=2125989 RepID=A0A8J6M8W9_9ALTE|nr:ATP-binding cassette domain-containing protein [Neptunicella marina]MBC3767901.1 ATP-binding cassette domain-containing protein [Neptunicella marina]
MTKFIVLILAVVHAVAGLVLLLFSSWFIAACAIAGVNFNYMLPAVLIRALALIRIASGYGYMWFGHQQLLDELSEIRLSLFKKLKTGLFKQQAQSIDVLAEHTEALANLWIGWVVQNAGAVLMLLLCTLYFLFAFPLSLFIGIAFSLINLALLIQLYSTANKLTSLQVNQQHNLRSRSEDYLQSASLWHLYDQQPSVNAQNIWQTQQQLQQRTQLTLLLTQFIGLILLAWFLVKDSGQYLGNANLLVIVIMLVSVKDWLTPAASSQHQYARYQQAKQHIQQQQVTPVNVCHIPDKTTDIHLVNFKAPYGINRSIDLDINNNGIVLLEGGSGSGKTSLLKAIYGLNDFNGQRQVNGNLIPKGIITSWYYANQHPMILNDTLEANLNLATDSDMDQQNLKQALFWADLTHLSDSLTQWLGYSGRKLSGGEAKRLNIARAYLSGADVWLLDEPFEGLAPQQQMFLSHQLNVIAKDKIIIIASHIFPDNLEINKSINIDEM